MVTAVSSLDWALSAGSIISAYRGFRRAAFTGGEGWGAVDAGWGILPDGKNHKMSYKTSYAVSVVFIICTPGQTVNLYRTFSENMHIL